MKNLKIILGVAIIAALTMGFASCGDPEPDPDQSWTVTFESNGGSTVASATVQDGTTVDKPNATKIWTPQNAGFYPASQVATWQKDGKDYDFSAPVRSDLTLKAKWDNPAAITLTGGGSSVEQAARYVNEKADKFILALGADVTSLTATLDKNYADLTIIGVGGAVRNINLTTGTKNRLFVVGPDSGSSSAVLTIGNNVTLNGVNDNTTALILVQNGATVTLLTGSKVTGNSSDGTSYSATTGSPTNNHGYGVGGIHVDGANLSLEGGTITGNVNNMGAARPNNTTKKNSAAGVYVEAGGTVYLRSGSVTGNTNTTATPDIYTTQTGKIIWSGSATAGETALGFLGTANASITIGGTPVTSSGNKINLLGNFDNWKGKQVITGSTAGFVLNQYIAATNSDIGKTLTADGKMPAN